jgi:hypothetical protein
VVFLIFAALTTGCDHVDCESIPESAIFPVESSGIINGDFSKGDSILEMDGPGGPGATLAAFHFLMKLLQMVAQYMFFMLEIPVQSTLSGL